MSERCKFRVVNKHIMTEYLNNLDEFYGNGERKMNGIRFSGKDPVSILKSHIRFILASPMWPVCAEDEYFLPEKLLSFEASMPFSEDYLTHLLTSTLDKVEQDSRRTDAFLYTRRALKYMCAVFVVLIGHDTNLSDKPLEASEVGMIVHFIRALHFCVDPNDLCKHSKRVLAIVYVYEQCLYAGKTILHVQSLLNGFSKHFDKAAEVVLKDAVGKHSQVQAALGKESFSFLYGFSKPGLKSALEAVAAETTADEKKKKSLKEIAKAKALAKQKALEDMAAYEKERAAAKRQRKERQRRLREHQRQERDREQEEKQAELEAYRAKRTELYEAQVRKEQENRKLAMNAIRQAHVLSPSKKREAKLRRLERQEESHRVWRAQKRNHRGKRLAFKA